MKYKEFKHRTDHNLEQLKKCLENKQCLTSLLDKVYTFDTKPGEVHSTVLMRNCFDIIPSLYLGVLANLESNGVDAFNVFPDGEIENIEIKTSEFDSQKIWKGPQGGLNIGLHNHKNGYSALTSKLGASYDIYTQEALQSKKMRTVLMVSDVSGPKTYIDAFEVTGQEIIKLLSTSRAKKKHIKLGSFLKYGRRSKTKINLIGFNQYKEIITPLIPEYNEWKTKNLTNDKKGI